MTFSSFFLFEM